MKNLTLIIPTKKESESLPNFLDEIKNLTCKKMVVLQSEDIETLQSIKSRLLSATIFPSEVG